MKKNRIKSKIFYFGLILAVFALVLNQWVVALLISNDGKIEDLSNKIIIWIIQLYLILFALTLISFYYKPLARIKLLLFCILFSFSLLIFLEVAVYLFNVVSFKSPKTLQTEVNKQNSFIKNNQEKIVKDDNLGYKLIENADFRYYKEKNNSVVFDVNVSTDSYGRRTVLYDNSDSKNKFSVFFGGSITYGEGLNDNQTIPYYFSKCINSFEPYNYAFRGYGPQQMLAILQNNNMKDELKQDSGVVIYVYMNNHIERAVGAMFEYNHWIKDHPYYYVDTDGNLVRKGSFKTGRPIVSALYSLLGKSKLFAFLSLDLPPISNKHYVLTTKIIKESKDIIENSFEDTNFYVVIYPIVRGNAIHSNRVKEIIGLLKDYNINYFDYSDLFDASDPNLQIADDGHPNVIANKLFANRLCKDFRTIYN